jgi:hypothetical protein
MLGPVKIIQSTKTAIALKCSEAAIYSRQLDNKHYLLYAKFEVRFVISFTGKFGFNKK